MASRALATMHSASSIVSRLSFLQTSTSEMREYETEILRRPVLITFARSLHGISKVRASQAHNVVRHRGAAEREGPRGSSHCMIESAAQYAEALPNDKRRRAVLLEQCVVLVHDLVEVKERALTHGLCH